VRFVAVSSCQVLISFNKCTLLQSALIEAEKEYIAAHPPAELPQVPWAPPLGDVQGPLPPPGGLPHDPNRHWAKFPRIGPLQPPRGPPGGQQAAGQLQGNLPMPTPPRSPPGGGVFDMED
jgi:hypothetical protein